MTENVSIGYFLGSEMVTLNIYIRLNHFAKVSFECRTKGLTAPRLHLHLVFFHCLYKGAKCITDKQCYVSQMFRHKRHDTQHRSNLTSNNNCRFLSTIDYLSPNQSTLVLPNMSFDQHFLKMVQLTIDNTCNV